MRELLTDPVLLIPPDSLLPSSSSSSKRVFYCAQHCTGTIADSVGSIHYTRPPQRPLSPPHFRWSRPDKTSSTTIPDAFQTVGYILSPGTFSPTILSTLLIASFAYPSRSLRVKSASTASRSQAKSIQYPLRVGPPLHCAPSPHSSTSIFSSRPSGLASI